MKNIGEITNLPGLPAKGTPVPVGAPPAVSPGPPPTPAPGVATGTPEGHKVRKTGRQSRCESVCGHTEQTPIYIYIL